jgi:hypothetical protein
MIHSVLNRDTSIAEAKLLRHARAPPHLKTDEVFDVHSSADDILRHEV